ncbi:MAG: ATP-binding protein [Spirochaetes bacterium]|nr:ATP-binding protein [Spirochaetota bacterium]
MIAEFTVENFRSFKDRRTFSLLATKNKELLEENTFEASNKERLLKSAVIYGANASGKSNFFNAFLFFWDFAVMSAPRKQAGDVIETEPFSFSKQTESAPSSFELVFFIQNSEGKNIRYRYGFSVSQTEVITEYLFAVFNAREAVLFTRDRQNINTGTYFREGSKVKSMVRPNCSFLSVCAQSNGSVAVGIIRYFQQMLIRSGLRESPVELHDGDFEQVLSFLQYADIQIKKITVKREPVNIHDFPTAFSKEWIKKLIAEYPEKETYLFDHDYFDNEEKIGTVSLPEQEESSGTRKLFRYALPVIFALKNGGTLFIDEFDAQLHPLIIESIVRLFNSSDNKKNAQLVISCHAVNIMTKTNFRRDQIWFCEKNIYGATDLYSLVEYDEPVRNDAAFGKNYLNGKYGATPYIGLVREPDWFSNKSCIF